MAKAADTVPIERELLEKVLVIASEGISAQRFMAKPGDIALSIALNGALDDDIGKLYQARRILQGEQEPIFETDEKETGDVRHRTDGTA